MRSSLYLIIIIIDKKKFHYFLRRITLLVGKTLIHELGKVSPWCWPVASGRLCMFPSWRCQKKNCDLQYHKNKNLKSFLPPPPIRNFQPSISMYSELDTGKLVLYLSPYHIHRILLLRRVLEFIMMGNLLKPLPHFNPSILWKLAQLIHQITRF